MLGKFLTMKKQPPLLISPGGKKFKLIVDDNGVVGTEEVIGTLPVLDGDGQEYYTLAPTALSFRSTEPLDEFKEVNVNGQTVDPSNYTLEEGSTIVNLSIDYLKTLPTGNYTIDIVSANSTTSGSFSVAAPELNEHGFYYNQPYTAYVEAFNGDTIFFFRSDNMMDCMVDGMVTETATFTSSGNSVVVNSMMGTFNGMVSANGTEVYCPELATTFRLSDESAVADEDYIYIYKEDLGGYKVFAIDKTKTEYGAIKTGINGKPSVSISDSSFEGCANLSVAPEIPHTITTIELRAFQYCYGMNSVIIPNSVIHIMTHAFNSCTNLSTIHYDGTVEQWNAITLDNEWNKDVPATHVQCTDGTVAI